MRSLSLVKRNMKEIYRDPVSSLLGLGLPVALLFLFTSIYQKIQVEMFSAKMLTPGIIIFSYSFLMMFSATLMAKDRQNAFLLRLFSTPLRPVDFILAYLLPFLPLALIMMTVCLLVGFLLGAVYLNILWVILILFMMALSCIGLGMIMGALLSVNQISGIGSLMITSISLFGNIWTPLEIMGGLFSKIGYAMPFAHAMDTIRWLVEGNPITGVAGHFTWVLVYTVVLTLGGVLAFRWRTRPG